MISSNLKVEFVCPRCQGRTWEVTAEGGLAVCKRQGCDFMWSRDKDWEVFAVVGIARFSSAEEYAAATEVDGDVSVVVSSKKKKTFPTEDAWVSRR